ncbi:MAG: peptide deformylase [Nitrospinota bacterium]
MADGFNAAPTVIKVVRIGNPVLRKEAQPLSPEEIKDPKTAEFIESMVATMREYGGAGLAAPQVNVSKQIMIIEESAGKNRVDGVEHALTVLINPQITSFSDEAAEGWEGCLSVPDLWGRVRRSVAVTVKAISPEGNETEIKADGYFAVKLQHEIDHLYGKLFIDRMEDLSTLCFTEEQHKYWNE